MSKWNLYDRLCLIECPTSCPCAIHLERNHGYNVAFIMFIVVFECTMKFLSS